jgi:hypothetical protein
MFKTLSVFPLCAALQITISFTREFEKASCHPRT